MSAAIELKIIANMIELSRERLGEGVSLLDMEYEYKKRFGYFIDMTALAFHSLSDFCDALVQQSHGCLRIGDRNVDRLKCDRMFYSDNDYRVWIESEKRAENYVLLEALASNRLAYDVSLHSHQRRIPALELPQHALASNRLKCYSAKIIHVNSPHEIYIHLRLNKYEKEYKLLRESLRVYDKLYCTANDVYVFPPELALAGYYCVVTNPDDSYNWHRAVILSVTDGHFVKLFAIDYGNIINTTVDELRLMRRSHLNVAPLAIKVSLAGIAPFGHKWIDAANVIISKFLGHYSQHSYLACIFLEQLDQNFYNVILSDHSPYQRRLKITYIHEELVRLKLAVMTSKYTILDEFADENDSENDSISVKNELSISSENSSDFSLREDAVRYVSNEFSTLNVSKKCCENKLFPINEPKKYCINESSPINVTKKYSSNDLLPINEPKKYCSNELSTRNERKNNNSIEVSSTRKIEKSYWPQIGEDDSELSSIDEHKKFNLNESSLINVTKKYFSNDFLPINESKKYYSNEFPPINVSKKYFSTELSPIYGQNKYFPKKDSIEYKKMYFPINEAIDYKKKYYELDKEIENKAKYFSTEH